MLQPPVSMICGRLYKSARNRKAKGIRTILFLDEIHRFNKLQQDALLPDVEEGNIVLIAATVENPFFYVNSALLSRSQVFELKHLTIEDIMKIMENALSDPERGLGKMNILTDEDALVHMARMSDGDGRKALSALEIARAHYSARCRRGNKDNASGCRGINTEKGHSV